MPVATENSERVEPGLWFQAALLPDGWAENVRLQIADGLISAVETGVAPRADDEQGSVAIPGLSNLHSHAFQRGMAGLAEVRGPGADTFWTWREVMYRFLDRLTPDDFEAIAAQAFVEMLATGFTRVGEFHYVHHDGAGIPYAPAGELAERICAAAATAGINLTLLPVFYAHANFGGADPTPGQRRFICTLDQYAGLLDQAEQAVKVLPGANAGVAPHSLRAVTPLELREIVALAGNRPIHIHAAEQIREVEDCLAATGQRPVEWLLTHAEVGSGWTIIHATHLTPAEIAGLAASGATAGLCPITEANLGDGIFPAAAFSAQGGRYGLGTDSNIHIHAAGELRALEYSQRLAQRGRNILAGAEGASTGRSLFEQALAGGQRALAAGPAGPAPRPPAARPISWHWRAITARSPAWSVATPSWIGSSSLDPPMGLSTGSGYAGNASSRAASTSGATRWLPASGPPCAGCSFKSELNNRVAAGQARSSGFLRFRDDLDCHRLLGRNLVADPLFQLELDQLLGCPFQVAGWHNGDGFAGYTRREA